MFEKLCDNSRRLLRDGTAALGVTKHFSFSFRSLPPSEQSFLFLHSFDCGKDLSGDGHTGIEALRATELKNQKILKFSIHLYLEVRSRTLRAVACLFNLKMMKRGVLQQFFILTHGFRSQLSFSRGALRSTEIHTFIQCVTSLYALIKGDRSLVVKTSETCQLTFQLTISPE